MSGIPHEWRRIAQSNQNKSLSRSTLAPSNLYRGTESRCGWSQFRPPAAQKLVRDAGLTRLEAVFLASDEPLSPRRIQKLAGLSDTGEVRRQVQRLAEILRADGSAFYVAEIAGGYQLLTRPDLRPWLDRICQVQSDTPLSGPMLETLAIVAYRQPICRADIEAIRGVQVGEILRHLLDRGLIRLAGKEETLGRPFLYATSKKFLQAFGLRNLHELPMVESLAAVKGFS